MKDSSARQSRVQSDTSITAADLTAIIDEFERNGLGDGQDVKMLRAVRDSLNTQSDDRMEQVLALLQKARDAQSDQLAKAPTAQAYAEQKKISSAMQRVLMLFQQQTDLLALSIQFSELAKRQNANFKLAKHLALKSMNSKEMDEGRLAELHVQQIEQDAIGVDVQARLDKLANLMEAMDAETSAQLSAAMQEVSPSVLKQDLSTSSSELRQAHAARAASTEAAAYHLLRDFSRLARPKRDARTLLTDAADELASTIKGYDVAMADTLAARNKKDKDDDAKLTIDDEQGDLVDDVTEVSKEIQTVAPEAFDALGLAKAAMQEARGQSLHGSEAQKQASYKLIAARQAVLDALAKQKQMDRGDTKMARAEAAQQSLNQLAQKQKEVMEKTKDSKTPADAKKQEAQQAEMTKQLKDLTRQAKQDQPEVANETGQAADTSQKADDQLSQNKPDQAADPQQKTMDSIAAAQKQADDQVAQMQQEEKALDQVQKTRDKLQKIEADEQTIADSTAKADANKEQQKQIAKDQQDVKKQLQKVQNENTPDGAAADDPMKDAAQEMQTAVQQLRSRDPALAKDSELAAIAAVQKATDAIDKKMGELKAQLGQPDDAAQQPQDAAADAVQQAVEKTADAQQSLKKGQPQAARGQLKEAAADAAKAQEQGTLPAETAQQLAQARDELGKAAADAERGKVASDHADKAESLLQQAKRGMQAAAMAKNDPAKEWKPDGKKAGDPPSDIHGSHIDTNGEKGNVASRSAFSGLPARDQAAISQSSQEKTPAQYQPMVEQYMKNLAQDSEAASDTK